MPRWERSVAKSNAVRSNTNLIDNLDHNPQKVDDVAGLVSFFILPNQLVVYILYAVTSAFTEELASWTSL